MVVAGQKLEPGVKAKLVAALRSGEYEQGVGYLQKEGKFCCLGVACDLYHKETGGGKWELGSQTVSSFFINFLHASFPPVEVEKWLGLERPNSARPYAIAHLAAMNDEGHSFEQIAQYIEENL